MLTIDIPHIDQIRVSQRVWLLWTKRITRYSAGLATERLVDRDVLRLRVLPLDPPHRQRTMYALRGLIRYIDNERREQTC